MPIGSVPWDRDDDIENLTPEDWEEVGQTLDDTLTACQAFNAWGFDAKFELYGCDPPLIIVRGPRSKPQSRHVSVTPGNKSHTVRRGSRRGGEA